MATLVTGRPSKRPKQNEAELAAAAKDTALIQGNIIMQFHSSTGERTGKF